MIITTEFPGMKTFHLDKSNVSSFQVHVLVQNSNRSLSYLFDFTVLEERIQNRNELMNSRNVTAPAKLTLTAKWIHLKAIFTLRVKTLFFSWNTHYFLQLLKKLHQMAIPCIKQKHTMHIRRKNNKIWRSIYYICTQSRQQCSIFCSLLMFTQIALSPFTVHILIFSWNPLESKVKNLILSFSKRKKNSWTRWKSKHCNPTEAPKVTNKNNIHSMGISLQITWNFVM